MNQRNIQEQDAQEEIASLKCQLKGVTDELVGLGMSEENIKKLVGEDLIDCMTLRQQIHKLGNQLNVLNGVLQGYQLNLFNLLDDGNE